MASNQLIISAAEYKKLINSLGKPASKKSKFGAVKTNVDGITFDSKKEAARYQQLLLVHKAKVISKPILQYEFCLPGNIKYRCDFFYYSYDKKKFIVEDCKGFKTPEYKLKKKLMLATLGIEILET